MSHPCMMVTNRETPPARFIDGKEVDPGLAVDEAGFGEPLALFGLAHQVGKQVEVVGAEHQVEIGDLFQEPFPLLLGNASPDGEDQPAVQCSSAP